MSTPEESLPPGPDEATRLRPLMTIANVVYGLQAVGLLVPITFIAGLIINYIKREDTQGTLLESHFNWQIRTFWFGLLWAVVGGLTAWLVVGIFVLIADFIWVMYRVIKGWLLLIERKPVTPSTKPLV